MSYSIPSCEVRIPTYKRPELLTRSIKSLISQTHENWRALVFEDSPEQEGKSIVEQFKDPRIIYRPHQQNIGRSKNLDHCFYSRPYIGGNYAFVLEDDNHLFPEFIQKNIQSLEESKVNILLRNQEKRLEQQDGKQTSLNQTTRGQWFTKGNYTPLELYSRLFFCEGISNGGLFWSTEKIISDLQVGTHVDHAWHQELFRTLSIKESVRFEDEPLCVFTEFECHPKLINFAPKHNRATQSILVYLVRKYGHEVVREAQSIATDSDKEILLEQKLLNALYLRYPFSKINAINKSGILLKSFARYILYTDPYKQILAP